MNPVALKIRWGELFPEKAPDAVRRARWDQWQKMARENDSENADYWNDCDETCLGCAHNDNSWCVRQSLPCTVNPVLTFQYNVIGMACMGVGYKNKQLALDL